MKGDPSSSLVSFFITNKNLFNYNNQALAFNSKKKGKYLPEKESFKTV